MSSGKDRGKHDGGRDESGRAGGGHNGATGPSTPPPWQPPGPKDAQVAAEGGDNPKDDVAPPMGGTPGRPARPRE